LWQARGDIGGGMQQGSELGAAALTKAVWWDFRLASLLKHLFAFGLVFFSFFCFFFKFSAVD